MPNRTEQGSTEQRDSVHHIEQVAMASSCAVVDLIGHTVRPDR